jgi:ubiquinone/menaquinone biosynthesis C-methylase UbiE
MQYDKFWSQYWQQGNKTSFGESLKNGYKGNLKKEWENVFSKLQPNHCVLDLCTGNLSLIRIAAQSLDTFEQVNFTGVDYANIEANSFVDSHCNVSLIPRVNIENLPCEDSSFDRVISNFGIEYSNLDKSINEVYRVLKPKGRIDLVCHHEESSLIKASSKELAFMNDLLMEYGILNKLEALLAALALNNDSINKEELRNEVNLIMSSLLTKYGEYIHASEFMAFFKYVFRKQTTDKIGSFKEYKQELIGYRFRIESMINASLNKESLLKINVLFKRLNLNIIKQNLLKENDEVIGYVISAEK